MCRLLATPEPTCQPQSTTHPKNLQGPLCFAASLTHENLQGPFCRFLGPFSCWWLTIPKDAVLNLGFQRKDAETQRRKKAEIE